MNRHERVIPLLGPYLDGELSPEETALVEAEVEECTACQAELEGLVAMAEAFRAPVLAAAQAASFEGMWDRIESQLGQKPVQQIAPTPTPAIDPAAFSGARRAAEPQPGLWQRLVAAWNDVFGAQPLVPAALAAALVVAVAVAVLLPDGRDKAPVERGGAEISAASPGKAPVGPVEPVEPVEIGAADEPNNRAWVSAVEYTKGTVIIDQIPDDPTEPTIVWHYDDEPTDEGTQGG